jgi:hypothetical protein
MESGGDRVMVGRAPRPGLARPSHRGTPWKIPNETEPVWEFVWWLEHPGG